MQFKMFLTDLIKAKLSNKLLKNLLKKLKILGSMVMDTVKNGPLKQEKRDCMSMKSLPKILRTSKLLVRSLLTLASSVKKKLMLNMKL